MGPFQCCPFMLNALFKICIQYEFQEITAAAVAYKGDAVPLCTFEVTLPSQADNGFYYYLRTSTAQRIRDPFMIKLLG